MQSQQHAAAAGCKLEQQFACFESFCRWLREAWWCHPVLGPCSACSSACLWLPPCAGLTLSTCSTAPLCAGPTSSCSPRKVGACRASAEAAGRLSSSFDGTLVHKTAPAQSRVDDLTVASPLSVVRDRKNTATKLFSGRPQACTSLAPASLAAVYARPNRTDTTSSVSSTLMDRAARSPFRCGVGHVGVRGRAGASRCVRRLEVAVRRSADALTATRQPSYGCAYRDVRWGEY